MTKDELIELAQVGMGIHSPNAPEYIVCAALIEALAQPEQLREENERLHVENRRLIDRIETIGVPVGVGGFATTTTAQRTWVGLTKEERHEISMANRPYCADIMAAHEEELKRRNT